MSGHGIVRKYRFSQTDSEEDTIQKYRKLQTTCFENKKAALHTHEAFDLTTQLLVINPELYSIWNYRRTLLPSFSDLPTELKWLTETIMVLTPKSYWVWNHRFWCLESGALGPAQWLEELKLLEKVLEKDPRNFHAWNYRRKVVPHISSTDEYAYTLNMISKGITNASAWHHRSTLPLKNFDEEIELVRKAVFTDPEDPPAWLYYRYLFAQPELAQNKEKILQEIHLLEELRDMEPDCKWVLTFLVYLYLCSIHGLEFMDKAKDCVDILKKLDPDRQEYYGSLVNT